MASFSPSSPDFYFCSHRLREEQKNRTARKFNQRSKKCFLSISALTYSYKQNKWKRHITRLYTVINQQRWRITPPFEILPALISPLSLSGLDTLSSAGCSSYHKTHTNNLTLVVDRRLSQHFLLAKNTEAFSVPLPGCVITLLPRPWKPRPWLSIIIRQTDSSCSLLYAASKTRLLSFNVSVAARPCACGWNIRSYTDLYCLHTKWWKLVILPAAHDA